jgi:hypothetical protein
MFYRFGDGSFVEASDFEDAKRKKIEQIQNEVEDEDNWHTCTCVGLSHRHDCPEMEGIIPF